MWPGCHQPQPPAPRKPGRGRPRPADSGGSSSLLPLPRAFLPSLLVLALEMGRGGTQGPDLPVKGTWRLSVKRGKSLAQPSESAALGRGWVPQPSGGTPKPQSLGPTPPQLQMPSRQCCLSHAQGTRTPASASRTPPARSLDASEGPGIRQALRVQQGQREGTGSCAQGSHRVWGHRGKGAVTLLGVPRTGVTAWGSS